MRRTWSIAWQTVRAQRWWALGWSGVAVVSSLLADWAGIGGAFLSIPLITGVALSWSTIAISGVVRVARSGQGLAELAIMLMTTVLCLALAVAAFLPMVWTTAATATAVRFVVNRPAYRAILGDLRRGRLRTDPQVWNDAHGVRYVIDSGPPVRVAFPGPGGFLDNWSGIVWDPTGRVMEADGWDGNGRFRAGPAITGLFGGDTVFCRPMTGVWYHCRFT